MSILQQIRKSNLSKQGQTNPSGKFEGVPANVAAAIRGTSVPISSPAIPPIQRPIDATFEARPQPTYLTYLQAAGRK